MPNNWDNQNRNDRQNMNFNRNESYQSWPSRGGDRDSERGSSLNQMGSHDHNYYNSDEEPYYDSSRESTQAWDQGRRNYGSTQERTDWDRDYTRSGRPSRSFSDRNPYSERGSFASSSNPSSYDRSSSQGSSSNYGGGTNYGTASTYGSSYGSGADYNRGFGSGSSYDRNNPYYGPSERSGSNAWDRYSMNRASSFSPGSTSRDTSGTAYGSFGREGDSGSMNFSSNVGKGPKNWKRTDERIREDVSEILERDPHINASEIEVMVKDGVVTLSGTVEHRLAKRHAEDIIENAAGVTDVKNELKVDQNIFSQMKEMMTGEQVAKAAGEKKSSTNPRH